MSVILGKHQSSIYRELNRNGSGGVYTGKEAQATSEQRRQENKPSPKTDNDALMKEITALFKKDLSPDQIAGRFKVQYPDQPEKQASTSTIYKHIYQETAKGPPQCCALLYRRAKTSSNRRFANSRNVMRHTC